MNRRQCVALCACILSACAPVKGYDGPELPEARIATVLLHHESDELHVSRASIDGVEFGPTGIQVTPGEHSLDISAAAKEPPRECRREYRFDDWGYSRCLSDARRLRRRRGVVYCNRQDFTAVIDHCRQELTDVNCSVVMTANAGERYELRLKKETPAESSAGARVSVLGLGKAEECSPFRTRTVTLEIRR